MFCSGCGQALASGQGFCPQCGRPVAPAVPAVPGLQYQVESYAGKVKVLSIFWFIYAGFSLVAGVAALAFAKAFLSGFLSPWMHNGPEAGAPMPEWFFPAILHFALVFLIIRSALALVAAWGLWQRSEWGRIVAIVAAVFSLLKFPFGTAMGIWTMVVLLGYRNTTLYEQLT
jgi:hypothetical protein